MKSLIKTDVEFLRKSALSHGASDAVVIPASEVILDPRVRFKCMIPKCYMSGGCAHCPPHGLSVREVRDIVSAHELGIFFRVRVESETIAASNIHDAIEHGILDNQGKLMTLGGNYILVFTIVKILEKFARQAGFAAYGFGAGNCRDPLCFLQPVCQGLMSNKGCRNPNLSAFSMESCGMDAYTMAARVGWDHYPIGGSCEPDTVPRGSLMGIVLVRRGA
jgi:predicted metal-binding protein